MITTRVEKTSASLSISGIQRNMVIPMIMIVFHDIRNRFPHNLGLYLLDCHVKAVIVQMPFLCLNVMRKYKPKHLTRVDQVNKTVNEQYLLAKLGYIQTEVKIKEFIKKQSLVLEAANDQALQRSRHHVDSSREMSISQFILAEKL
jgi:hypothetical protein